MPEGGQRLEPLAAHLFDRSHPFRHRLPLEEVERRIGRRTAERIAHVGRPVHQGMVGMVTIKSGKDLRGRHRHGHRERAPGQRLTDAENVGHHAGPVAGEPFAGPPEARPDLIGDEQEPSLPRDLRQSPQLLRRMKPHTGRTLHERLDDDAGALPAHTLEKLCERLPAFLVGR